MKLYLPPAPLYAAFQVDEPSELDVVALLDDIQQWAGPEHMPRSLFYSPGDLTAYLSARNSWPSDVTPAHACPSLYQLCLSYSAVTDHSTTFRTLLQERRTAAEQWVQDNAPAQRSTPASRQASDAAKQAYAVYLDLCMQRKKARQAVEDEWGPRVNEALAEWSRLRDAAP